MKSPTESNTKEFSEWDFWIRCLETQAQAGLRSCNRTSGRSADGAEAQGDDGRRAPRADPLFQERLAGGATLDDIMVEAFATVREAAVRTVDMRHFDVRARS